MDPISGAPRAVAASTGAPSVLLSRAPQRPEAAAARAAIHAEPSCSIRSIWILNSQDAIIVFSRRFTVVEKQWRLAYDWERDLKSLISTDLELASVFTERKNREGSVRGFGIHISQSAQGFGFLA